MTLTFFCEFSRKTMTDTPPPTTLDGPRHNPLRSDTCERCTLLGKGKTCVAFPEGIPDALWNAYRGHRDPFPGDLGIQFQAIPMPTGPVDIPDFLRKKPQP